MKRIALFFVLFAAALVPVLAQKIETETNDRTGVVHLKTALNHLTVIEVTEPVVQVAAGSPYKKVARSIGLSRLDKDLVLTPLDLKGN